MNTLRQYFSQQDINTTFWYFLSLTSVCLLTVRQGGHFCTWSHSRTHTHSEELAWTSDRPSHIPLLDNTQHSQETDIHASGGIRTRGPSDQGAADSHLRPRGHRDPPITHDHYFPFYPPFIRSFSGRPKYLTSFEKRVFSNRRWLGNSFNESPRIFQTPGEITCK